MKGIGKILSAGLSLTLCAALVAPSFAAQVLNSSFIDADGSLLGHDGNGNVATENARYDYELDGTLELEKTLVIKDGVEASIDLKGHDLVHTGATGSVISIKDGGKLELDDTTAETGEDGSYTAGHVTGGKGTNDNIGNTLLKEGMGGGVHVAKGGKLDMKGGIISGNAAEWGGGIGSNGTVTMFGGQIVNNTTNFVGAGVFNAGNFVMSDGEISGNTAEHDAGGIFNGGNLVMNNGKINGNTCAADGGGVYQCGGWNADGSEKASFTMNGGEISDNKSLGNDYGTGGVSSFSTGDSFVMNGGAIVRNSSGVETGSEADNTMSVTINYDNVTICNYGKDGVAETRHEFTNGAVEDAGADGHKITKECAHGCGTTDIIMEAHAYGAWQTVTAAQVGVAGVRKHTCTVCGHEETGVIPALTDQVEIDDPEVPLAGLFTRGDAIGYLWEQAGSPEAELSTFPDVPEDHQWAVAIGWAEDMGIALPDLEGNFRPDDLVLRSVEGLEVSPEGELQEFLNRYAAYAGIELAEDELFIELAGAWDDVIMGEEAQEIFDGFFAQLEAALAQAA